LELADAIVECLAIFHDRQRGWNNVPRSHA